MYVEGMNPPAGWAWYRRPDLRAYVDGQLRLPDSPAQATREQKQALYDWAIANRIMVGITRSNTRRAVVYIDPNESLFNSEFSQYWTEVQCEHGRTFIVPIDEFCDCPTPSSLTCTFQSCRRTNGMEVAVDGNRYCASHRLSCAVPNCEVVLGIPDHGAWIQFCPDHKTEFDCVACDRHVMYGTSEEPPIPAALSAGQRACWDCVETRTCMNCSEFFISEPIRWIEEDEQYLCSRCHNTYNVDRIEAFDDDDDTTPEGLALLHNDHRPIRVCSIELEAALGGRSLARALHSAGLTLHSEVLPYHASERYANTDSFCHVEGDSSLGAGGGELVISKINMTDPAQLDKLHQTVTVMRGEVKAGNIEINLRCGTHFHVDAHGFGIGHTRNLVLITNYLEDVIYRLSAARWRRHRGREFAIPTDKGPFPTRRDFGIRFFSRNEHHSALNLGNYWSAVRNSCRCGATIVGEYEACTCNLGKCTFEFRFFNGTSNFRKLHAYASLCQSMVSYAKLFDDLTEQAYPAMEYNEQYQSNFPADIREAWDARLRWMLANLYFSDTERDSLLYTVQTCALNELGDSRILDIFRTPYVRPSVPAQEVRNPADGITFPVDSLSSPPRFRINAVDYPTEPSLDVEYDDDEF